MVVTHNRAMLLQRCLEHLSAQIGVKPDVLVINNGSTDDTEKMLEAGGVDFITQSNLGSAGGWHRGIEEAKGRGYDAVWLMDDDGYPDHEALSVLVDGLEPGVACASSMVVREDDVDRFVFPFPRLDHAGLPVLFAWPRKYKAVKELLAATNGEPYPFAHFFNGALITVSAVERVGNVNRDFFIFGDEVDFFFRLRAAGRVLSVPGARHYHPDVTSRPYSSAKIYYYVRNTFVLHRRYFDHVFLRNFGAVVAALSRTGRRNGLMVAASYVFGRNLPVLLAAMSRGLSGRLGKDFNG